MENRINFKSRWVATSGWRGYMEFECTVAGANDTGSWSDSPCPSRQRKAEVARATSILRKLGIRYRTAWAKSSNVFMNSQHILVGPADRARAIEALKPLRNQTELLWVSNE